MTKSDQDRRRFFRITDAIGVSYSVLSDETSESHIKNKGADLIRHYDQLIDDGMAQLKEKNSESVAVLDALNHKLNTLLNLLELDSLIARRSIVNVEAASISACGVAFPVNEAVGQQTELDMLLYLKPGNQQVQVKGRVVDCSALAEDAYYLRVEFTDVDDKDREKLIQHIVQRQGSLLRSLREQDDG